MGGGYSSPRSWMITITTGTTTTPILDITLVVTLTLFRSIILQTIHLRLQPYYFCAQETPFGPI